MISSIRHPLGILLITVFTGECLFAQQQDSARIGAIKGSVKDTALNYFLQSATVAVNKSGDGSLVAYSMTNTLGEFHLKGLPTGISLKVSISYIGYRTETRTVTITKERPVVDLGEIEEIRGAGGMDSVVVTPPPVRMNGDTLEFSAAAFSLDKNAVAEDLLRKLPGVIVWGDGTITVNGKQISKLLVDGKPFLGKETQVATQNIPKSSIDKIQVYQEQVNLFDPLDSTSTINIKLRKGRHSGFFGAASGGEGTNGRYDYGANAVLFTPRTQFAAAGQANNINRLAGDVGTLLRNNTYKGVGVRVEYQPDFALQGRNEQASGGFVFTHDFVPAFNDYEKNRLSANSFLSHNNNVTTKNTQTVTYIGNGASLAQDNADKLNFTTDAKEFKAGYINHKDENTYTFDGAYYEQDRTLEDTLMNAIYASGGVLVSGDNESHHGDYRSNALTFEASYDHNGFSNISTRKLTSWTISYAIKSNADHRDSALQTTFTSLTDPTLSRFYDRRYDDRLKGLDQTLSMRLGDFSTWLFGGTRLSFYHVELKNELNTNIGQRDDAVTDRDTSTDSFIANTYLTANNRCTTVNEKPDLRVGRSFSFILANRYQKELSLYVNARGQVLYQDNSSSHAFQQFDYTYRKFIPAVHLDYTNFQYGNFLDKYSLNFDVSYDYPSVDQRVALVDSSNIYGIRVGNVFLRPARQAALVAKFRHDSYSTKNTFNYGAQVEGDVRKDNISDSSSIDGNGRYTFYTVNLDGYRGVSANLFLNKAFVSSSHQFQVNVTSFMQLARTPGFLHYQADPQAHSILTGMFINSDTLSLFYTFADRVAVNLIQNFAVFRQDQGGLYLSVFTNRQSATRLGIGVNVTKKLLFNSNITYNSSVTTGAGAAAYRYTIWNASMAYRFLPGNNLELKASALDLLNQNKGIINYGNNLSYTHGTVNILRQYFMVTLAYYPRRFGKK